MHTGRMETVQVIYSKLLDTLFWKVKEDRAHNGGQETVFGILVGWL